MAGPDREFWQDKFEQRRTPWDRGAPSPQLVAWLDSGALAPCRIAVPGCGAGHEVALLAARGFEVVALDYARAAVERTRAALAAAGASARVVEADVLDWRPDAPFDAVYEQTCVCALHPDRWIGYAAALHAWLRPGARLFALFAQAARSGAADGFIEGPPYHCDIHAMRALFDAARWEWPKPPYPRVPHPMGMAELAVVLARR
ncbi:MAG: methyltransferase domain-containing protein [Burkholderiales bacterium]|nr:methyltransferase domain-containing protein [Burkholderiales bacterium]